MNASFLRIIIATKLNQNCQEELILCSGEVHIQLHQNQFLRCVIEWQDVLCYAQYSYPL